jgi:predicted transcriptional regulator
MTGYRLGRTHTQYRNSHEIIKQMLQIVDSKGGGNGSKALEIAYTCGLTWNQFKFYRDLLLKRELVYILSSNNNEVQHYKISDSGKRYLQLFAEIEDDLKPLVKSVIS